MREKEIKIVTTTLNYALLIMSLASVYILIRFTLLHIVFFPEEIPYINQEAIILILSAVFFIASMKFKFKLAKIVSFIAIMLGVFNFLAFTTMSILYYKDLYLDAFI
ncbi:MAG TPA: hypothetical protein GX707_06555 [Epulopiscium sp.]|nr:hypothetical protein [Candidatus Epulonipiscium sp.]